ncbi:hypothetical protein F9K33_00120 [bacterium]|nr:MAG: hypothetical protein F9K33_00120 [bacterium]
MEKTQDFTEPTAVYRFLEKTGLTNTFFEKNVFSYPNSRLVINLDDFLGSHTNFDLAQGESNFSRAFEVLGDSDINYFDFVAKPIPSKKVMFKVKIVSVKTVVPKIYFDEVLM